MSKRVLTFILAGLLTVAGFIGLSTTSAMATDSNQASFWVNKGVHPNALCYKHEGTGSNSHGKVQDGAVILNTFNQSWPGDHWELLVVKGGSGNNGGGDAVYQHPSAGTKYYPPINPQNGKPFGVSHWIVCKGTTPSTPTTTTTVKVTTTTAQATTTTAQATTTTVRETTTTVEQTTTTEAEETTTTEKETTTTVEDTTTTDEETTTTEGETTTTQAETTTTQGETTTSEVATTTTDSGTTTTLVSTGTSPTTPPSQDTVVTTPNPDLPKTGAATNDIVWWSLIGVGLGIFLIMAARRPTPRP